MRPACYLLSGQKGRLYFDVAGFFIGCVCLLNLPRLPSWMIDGFGVYKWLILLVCLLFIVLNRNKNSFWRFVLVVLLGFIWSGWQAQARLEARLASELEGQSLLVEGVVEGLPKKGGGRFPFRITQWVEGSSPLVGLVRLGWSDPGIPSEEGIRLGQTWRLTVRLKRPRGLANPGDFDYERWLFQSSYIATGYVRVKESVPELLDSGSGLALWRQVLADGVLRALPDSRFSGVMAALLMGDRFGLSDGQWRVFRQTGTGHLVAISGLHVGLVAGLVFFLLRRLTGPWTLKIAAPRVAALVALVFAVMYAALAGFTLPTQRALIMLSVGLGAVMMSRQIDPFRALALALFLVLIRDPLAVLSGGFWLSFSAVALILVSAMGRVSWVDKHSVGALWRRWGKVHWLVSLGLAPVTLLWFGQASLISPLANLIAVPWVSIFVVPASLLGGVLMQIWPWLGGLILKLGEWFLAQLWPVLLWASEVPNATWQPLNLGVVAVVSLLVVVFMAIAPSGWPGRWLAVPLFISVLIGRGSDAPDVGDYRLSVLDVGQGLSVLVQTANHRFLYDAGPKYRSGFDTGASVVLPFLKSRGVDKLDVLMMSHGDRDHSGGYEAVRGGIEVGRILSGEPHRIAGSTLCMAGMQWRWDGVLFQVLGPHGLQPLLNLRGNNASCVVRVSNDGGAVLLTADLEVSGERLMLKHYGAELEARVLQVPHHGSRTSSSVEFIETVSAEYAIVTSGYRNHFGLPKEDVMQRYQDAHVEMFNTDHLGMVELEVYADGRMTGPHSWRLENSRLWTMD